MVSINSNHNTPPEHWEPSTVLKVSLRRTDNINQSADGIPSLYNTDDILKLLNILHSTAHTFHWMRILRLKPAKKTIQIREQTLGNDRHSEIWSILKMLKSVPRSWYLNLQTEGPNAVIDP